VSTVVEVQELVRAGYLLFLGVMDVMR